MVRQDGTLVLAVERGIPETGGEVVAEDLGDGRHVLVEVPDVGIAGDEGVGDGLGDLGLPLAGVPDSSVPLRCPRSRPAAGMCPLRHDHVLLHREDTPVIFAVLRA